MDKILSLHLHLWWWAMNCTVVCIQVCLWNLLSVDWCVVKLTNCIIKNFQLTSKERKRWIHSKGGSLQSVFVVFNVSWLYLTQNSCQLKRGVFSPWRGDKPFAEVRLNQSFTSSAIVPPKNTYEYLFSLFIVNMFSCQRGPIDWRNEKVFLSPFLSVTMMLQVPWGSQDPTGGSKGTVNKEHFSCTPVVPSDSLRAKQRLT